MRFAISQPVIDTAIRSGVFLSSIYDHLQSRIDSPQPPTAPQAAPAAPAAAADPANQAP